MHPRVYLFSHTHTSSRTLFRADVSQLIALASRQFNAGNQTWGFPLVVDLAELISRVFPEVAVERAREIESEVGMTCDV
jgi:Na+/phosphate symporter